MLARHHDPSYGATNNPRPLLYAFEMHRVAWEETRKTHIAPISPRLHGRVFFTLLTQRNSLSLFNVRVEVGHPSLSRTLCQSMIVEAQRNHRTEHRKEDVIQKRKRWDTLKLCEIHILYPSILFTNDSSFSVRPFIRLYHCSFTVLFGLVLLSYISLFLYLISSGVKIFWNGLLAKRRKWTTLFEQIFSEIFRIKVNNISNNTILNNNNKYFIIDFI